MAKYIKLPDNSLFPVAEGEDYSTAMRAAYLKYPDAFGDAPAKPSAAQNTGPFGDAITAAKQAAFGSAKALTDIAGANNFASNYLEEKAKAQQVQYSPAAQEEMKTQAERMKAAEASGSTLEEIKAGALNVAEAPLRSLAQGIGSLAPYVPAMLLGPIGGALRLAPATMRALTGIAEVAPKVLGTAQGVGTVKGSIYDAVYKNELDATGNEQVARNKAEAAQNYAGNNLDNLIAGGVLGFVAGSTGAEKLLTKSGAQGAAQGFKRRVGQAAGEEFLTEGAQGGQERFAQNIALQREGVDIPAMQGVAGQAVQEGLVGALTAGPVAALRGPTPTLSPQQVQAQEQAAIQQQAQAQAQAQAAQAKAAEDAYKQSDQYAIDLGNKYDEVNAQRLKLQERADALKRGDEVDKENYKYAKQELDQFNKTVFAPLLQEYAPLRARANALRAVSVTPVQPTAEAPVTQLESVASPVEAPVAPTEPVTPPIEATVETAVEPVDAPIAEVSNIPPVAPTMELPRPTLDTETTTQNESSLTGLPSPTETMSIEAPASIPLSENETESPATTLESQSTEPAGIPVVEQSIDGLKLSKDVPQFKSDADASGVVDKLQGKYDRALAAPIQVWQRINGDMEVISGRHRFDLAKRSSEKTVPVQIHREADGFTAKKAALLDTELNVKDGRGKVKDYVKYFKALPIDRDEATQSGLLQTAIGRNAFSIANAGSDELIASHSAAQLTDQAAVQIAQAAPNDSSLQAVGMRQVLDGKPIAQAVNTMLAAKLVVSEGQQSQSGDMFDFDDSGLKMVQEMAKIASSKQYEVGEKLRAVRGAAKRPELAAKEGVNVNDPVALDKRIQELETRQNALDNWTTSPELVQEIRESMKPQSSKANKVEQPEDVKAITPEEATTPDEDSAALFMKNNTLTEGIKKSLSKTSTAEEVAESHAKDLGGQVVYRDGDIALVRGFNAFGRPVYLVTNKDMRSRNDISAYTGNLVSDQQRAKLVSVKQNFEAADANKHAANPFIKFNANGLASSKNTPPQLAGVLAGWKKLLGVDAKIYISTLDDAIADKNKFTGNHRSITSAALDGASGSMRSMGDGQYYITFKSDKSTAENLETLAHELGHIHEKEVFSKVPEATRLAILGDYNKWLASQKSATAKQLVESLRARKTGKNTEVSEKAMAADLTNYWRSFGEWYADQVSRWATTSEKPLTVVEKFFSRLGAALKSFYQKLVNRKYLPTETFKDYLESVNKNAADIGLTELQKSMPQDQIALFMSKNATSAPTSVGQQALDNLEKMGREVKQPEAGYIEKVRGAWDNAKDNPKVTIEAAKDSFQRFGDLIQTLSFSSDAALNNQIKREVMDSAASQKEKIGLLLNTSLSQTFHSDAVANLFLRKGDIKYNADLHKWEGVESKNNFLTLAQSIDKVATKYGLTMEQAELVAHTAFEAKRTKSLVAFNEDLKAKTIELRAAAADERKKGNAVKASALSAQASTMSQKEKFIHMSDEDIQIGLSQIDLMPELKDSIKIWNGIRENTTQKLIETGLWSEADADFLLSNADYVPFYREEQLEEGNGPKGYIAGLQVQAKERRLKGSSKPVNNIFDNMVNWTQYSVNRAVRNRSALSLAETAESVGLATKAKNMKDGNNVVRVWKNGEEAYFDMKDPLFMSAFQGLESVSIPTIKFFSKFADILRNTVVLNPLFAVTQLPQDSFAAMFSSGLKPQFALTIPFRAVKEFLLTLANKSKTHEELKNVASTGVPDFSSSMIRLDAKIAAGLKPSKGLWGKVKDSLGHIAMASDNAVRQATYEAAMSQGVSRAEAIEKSFEIFNVRRRGTSKMLNIAGQVIPFFYAYLAAQNVLVRTITGTGTSPTQKAEAYKALISTSASVFALSVLYAMMNGDDEDYINKPTPTRDRLLMIPGTGMAIPLRADLFTLPKVIAEHTYLLLTNNGYADPAKFRSSVASVISSAILSPTPVPQAIKPLVEVAINYNFFQQKPLIGTFQQKKDIERQFEDSTSELGKLFGKTGLISPIGADHIIRGMFGSAGGMLLYATNPFLWNASAPNSPRPSLSLQDALATIPNASGVITKEYETGLKKDFFALKEVVDKASSTLTDMKQRSPLEVAEYVKDEKIQARLGLSATVANINSQLSMIRKNISAITNSGLSADAKEEKIKNLKRIENNMMMNLNLKSLREKAMM